MSAQTTTQIQDNQQHVELSLLDEAIRETKQTEPNEVKSLLRSLTTSALDGVVSWDRSITKTINQAIAKIDQIMSEQLREIMQHQELLRLEGAWRGLQYLINNTETGATMKIKVMNVSKKDLYNDLNKAVEFDQSQLFKKVYENEFGSSGGEPYSILIGDYNIGNHPEDLNLIQNISHVAAGAFCPFITAADATLFGFDDWPELSKVRDLEKIFQSQEYVQWRDFRDTDDSRFVNLVLPRALARLPYGQDNITIDEFAYEESLANKNSRGKALSHNSYCWMNAAYVMAERIANAFSKYGWCTAIRGAEGGGKVESLPTHIFQSDDGDLDIKCPTEIGITDRREAELSKLGFLPLCHYKNTSYAVFFGAQSAQKPKKYDSPEATSNAAISARLPYILASSRFAHYLKIMGRDKIGSFMEARDAELWLNKWILNYVNSNPDVGQEMKASFPLSDAKIKVVEIPGAPGSYNAVAWLNPWLQMEELTTSLRLVAKIPEMS